MYFTSLIAYIVIAQIVASFIRVILEQWSKRTGKASDSPNFLVHLGVTLVSVVLFFSNYVLELTPTLFDFMEPCILINTEDGINTAVVTIESETSFFTPSIYYTVKAVSNGLEADPSDKDYALYEDHFTLDAPSIVKAYSEVLGIRTRLVKASYSPQFPAAEPLPPEDVPAFDTPSSNDPAQSTGGKNSESEYSAGDAGTYENGGDTFSESIYDSPAPPISEIGLSVPDFLTVGDELFATAIVYPVTTDQRSLFWETSDGNVLSVDDEGYICALSPGNVLLRVTSEVNPSVYTERQIYIESLFSSDDDDSVSDLSVDDIFFIDVGERRRIIGWDESIEASHIERIGCGVIADIDIIDGCIMGISEGTAIIEACVSTSCGNISYRWKVVVSDPEANFVTDE